MTEEKIILEKEAGVRDQQLSLVSAAILAGVDFLGAKVSLPARSAVSEAVVGLYTAPAEIIDWVGIETCDR